MKEASLNCVSVLRSVRLNALTFLLTLATLGQNAALARTPASDLPPADEPIATLDAAQAGWDVAALDAALAFAGSHGTTGLVVVHNGRIVAERYWDEPADVSERLERMVTGKTADGHTIEDVASVQKSVIAFLAGVAEGRGLLDLEQPVAKYLGEGWSAAPADQEAAILVRHLMSMTSGLAEDGAYSDRAGEVWRYNTRVYSRMLQVLEAATGSDIHQLTSTWLTDRIGMSDSGWTPRPWLAGAEDANKVGFSTSARDLARFGLLILAEGVWRDDDLLGNPGYLARALDSSQDLNPSYGLLWWLNGKDAIMSTGPDAARRPGPMLPTAPDDLVAAQGALGRRCFVVPSLGLVVTRLGDQPDEPREFDTRLWELLIAAMPTAD